MAVKKKTKKKASSKKASSKKTVKKLIQAIPQDRILWHQDIKDLVDEVEEQMEKHDVRD